jgi:hypothetical protein
LATCRCCRLLSATPTTFPSSRMGSIELNSARHGHDTPLEKPQHTPFHSNVTAESLSEQWRQHFKRHSPLRRQQTRTGLWHSILRYQEQNEAAQIRDIACTNVKKRAMHSTRFTTMNREDMVQVTATVLWSNQQINPAHLGLTRLYYEAHGYAIDNAQTQVSPQTGVCKLKRTHSERVALMARMSHAQPTLTHPEPPETSQYCSK